MAEGLPWRAPTKWVVATLIGTALSAAPPLDRPLPLLGLLVTGQDEEEIRQAVEVLQDLRIVEEPRLPQLDDAPLGAPQHGPGPVKEGGNVGRGAGDDEGPRQLDLCQALVDQQFQPGGGRRGGPADRQPRAGPRRPTT